MAASPNPIGCSVCSPSEAAPVPLPAPTQPPQGPFSFFALPNSLTCAPATVSWSYHGPPEPFTLAISQAHPLQIHTLARMVKVRRDATSFLIAGDIAATDLTFTWPLVNVPSGWYVLKANGTGIFATSPEFFVGRGVNSSCLDALPPLAPPFTSSTPVATIPVSGLFVSSTISTNTLSGFTPLPSVITLNSSAAVASTKDTGVVVGGLVGAAVLLAAAFAIIRSPQSRKFVLRLPMFLKRGRGRFPLGSGSSSRSPRIATATSLNGKKADRHGPQPEAKPFSSPSVPSISISSVPDAGAPAAAASTVESKGEVQSQRSLALAALNTNSAGPPARSFRLSQASAEGRSGSSLRTQRPRLLHTPAALHLSLSLSTPSSSARSQQTSFASGPATESPVPSSATSQMYPVRGSGASQWVSVGTGSPTVAEAVEPEPEVEAGNRGTVIVQARRVVVTAGEMRAVRRDFPETPFPLSPDYR